VNAAIGTGPTRVQNWSLVRFMSRKQSFTHERRTEIAESSTYRATSGSDRHRASEIGDFRQITGRYISKTVRDRRTVSIKGE